MRFNGERIFPTRVGVNRAYVIVEDDPETANLLAATMRQIGFTSLVAADGYQAWTHLKRDAVTQTIPVITISAHVADMEQERTTDATEAGGD